MFKEKDLCQEAKYERKREGGDNRNNTEGNDKCLYH